MDGCATPPLTASTALMISQILQNATYRHENDMLQQFFTGASEIARQRAHVLGQVLGRPQPTFVSLELSITGESVSCVYWKHQTLLSSNDIIKAVRFIVDPEGLLDITPRKFEEHVFSVLRQYQLSLHYVMEESNSSVLNYMQQNQIIKTKKRQKLFYLDRISINRIAQLVSNLCMAGCQDLKSAKKSTKIRAQSADPPSVKKVEKRLRMPSGKAGKTNQRPSRPMEDQRKVIASQSFEELRAIKIPVHTSSDAFDKYMQKVYEGIDEIPMGKIMQLAPIAQEKPQQQPIKCQVNDDHYYLLFAEFVHV